MPDKENKIKKIILLIALIGAVFANATTLNIVKEKSNSYYKSISSIVFVGSNELIGNNKEITGFISYENNKILNGEITILTNGFDTQNQKRDKRIHEILNAKTHPKITFLINEQFEENNQQFIKGILKINGIEKAQTIQVEIKYDDDEVLIQGNISVKYEDFGIKRPSFGGFLTKAKETIEIGGEFVFFGDKE